MWRPAANAGQQQAIDNQALRRKLAAIRARRELKAAAKQAAREGN